MQDGAPSLFYLVSREIRAYIVFQYGPTLTVQHWFDSLLTGWRASVGNPCEPFFRRSVPFPRARVTPPFQAQFGKLVQKLIQLEYYRRVSHEIR